MANNVKKEFELYEPMRIWLQQYLEDKYKGSQVITIDSHARTLDVFLEEHGVIDQYPQTVGLDIQLNLHDLGQLWAYCKLCDPVEAFLLSSNGTGSLNKILNNLSREDLLDFGDGKRIKKMVVGKWDISTSGIDFKTVVPKI